MAIEEHIKECIEKNLFSSKNQEILFKYTEKIKCNNKKWDNLLLNSGDEIFHISYPNQTAYMGIGKCRKYTIKSNKELIALKNIKHKIQSYGKGINKVLKLFGGICFNLNQKPKDHWKDIPKGLFFIPKFLITRNKE